MALGELVRDYKDLMFQMYDYHVTFSFNEILSLKNNTETDEFGLPMCKVVVRCSVSVDKEVQLANNMMGCFEQN